MNMIHELAAKHVAVSTLFNRMERDMNNVVKPNAINHLQTPMICMGFNNPLKW